MCIRKKYELNTSTFLSIRSRQYLRIHKNMLAKNCVATTI